MGEEFGGGAAAVFLEGFAQLAGDADFALGEVLGADGEGFQDAVGALEEDGGLGARGGEEEVALASAALRREEAGVEEFLRGKAGADEGGEDGAGGRGGWCRGDRARCRRGGGGGRDR